MFSIFSVYFFGGLIFLRPFLFLIYKTDVKIIITLGSS